MKRVDIIVPDMNDSLSRIVILGAEYLLRFSYNDTFDYWSFGLYYPNKEPIIQNIKIIPNFPLNLFFGIADVPAVIFGCDSKLEHIGRNAFKEEVAKFFYIER